jgi:hypothetical protein
MLKNKWFCSGAGMLVVFLSLVACSRSEEPSAPLFEEVLPSHSGIYFENNIVNEENFNILNYRNFYNGGGVGIGDINNDGLPDVFLVSNMADNKLYLNRGNFVFEDITDKAGVKGKRSWSTGVTMVDINGDGFLDIYVCNSGNRSNDNRANELFINNGDATFKESASEYGLADTSLSTHAAFFDYDRDGDLDAYIVNNSFYPIGKLGYRNLRNIRDSLGGDKLLQNNNGRFTDVSQQAGIFGSLIGFGLGVTVGDMNNDNWPDIYISNDFYEHDYYYINNKNGTFTESVKQQMGHLSYAAMGADLADINNDGYLDLFVTDMLPRDDRHLKQVTSYDTYDLYALKLTRDYHHQITQNALQLNNGNGTFSEIARLAGVDATDWSWGALLFDMDNDGWKDIFVSNGIARDLTDIDFLKFLSDETQRIQQKGNKKISLDEMINQMPVRPQDNYAFNNNKDLTFEEKPEWGLKGPGFSNGAAYGDLDNDGDLDLIVNNVNHLASVYKNSASDRLNHRSISIKLKGYARNTFGIGARLLICQGAEIKTMEQMPSRGFESSVDYKQVIGLGDGNVPDSIVVIWPDDKMQVLKGISGNEITVSYAEANQIWQPVSTTARKMLRDVTQDTKLDYTHIENEYVDFYRDPLLKQKYSTQGPGLATGDVNGDGLEDIIFCGARGQSTRLYVQQKDFTFRYQAQPVFDEDKVAEDVAASLADMDQDGDLDLFVVTGSNEFEMDDPALADRLYLNDGKGNFSKASDFPSLTGSGSCVTATDFDKDGDVDLFVGGRLIPGQYGMNPPSYLLTNNGRGSFKNFTSRYIENNLIGMVTDAVWQDLDNDSYPELIVVGDWMNITIFKNEQGKKLSLLKPMTHLAGWWNTIKAVDIDGDSDVDLIVGNSGTNSRIRADSLHPAQLYISDFDKNGSIEQIINCVSADGKNYPMVLKHDLERILPLIKKRFLENDKYAGQGMRNIFTEPELKQAVVKEVNESRSGVLRNNGNWNFSWEPFPVRAQFSPVHAIETMDIDRDGHMEILLAGNFFDVLPELGRYDASYGIVLREKGKGEFEVLPPEQSGFFIRGQVRRMKVMKRGDANVIIVAKNNDSAQVIQSNRVP